MSRYAPNTSKTHSPVAADSADHAHHWRIEEANGPTSGGVCKVCGVAREFKNWLMETDFTTRTEHELAA